MKVVKMILEVNESRKRLFGVIVLVALLDGLFFYSVSILIASFQTRASIASYFGLTIQIISIYLLNLVSSYLIRRFGEMMALTSSELAKQKLLKEVMVVPLLSLQKYHSGYLLSLINKIADFLPQLIFQLFWWACRGIVVSILFFGYVASESWWIALFDGALIVIFIMISQILSTKILPLNLALNEKKADFLAKYADFLTNITTVKRLGLMEYVTSQVARSYREVYLAVVNQQLFHAKRWALLHGLFGMMFISTISFFLFQVNRGLIEMNVFIILIAFFIHLRGDLNSLAENLKLVTELTGYISQLEVIIGKNNHHPQISPKSEFDTIAIKNASFSYLDSSTELIIPDFRLQKGEIIAIVGVSGQGKSTLLSILAGHLQLTSGRMEMKGGSTDDFTFVSQEVELFNLSLRENLVLGKNISDQAIINHLSQLDLEKLIFSHPEGLGIVIGEKGLKLSSGQKQRINIIRSILLEKNLILLDEPLSHLDKTTIVKVITYLQKYLRGKTAVIVSHQSEILKLADRVYEIADHRLQLKA